MHHHRHIDLDKIAAHHVPGTRSQLILAPHEFFEWKTTSDAPVIFTPQSADRPLNPECLEALNGMQGNVLPHSAPGWIGYYTMAHPHLSAPLDVQVIIASGLHAVCSEFTARHNQYFIWYNDSDMKVHIDCADHKHMPQFWHRHGYHIPEHGSVAVLVPATENVGFYELKVTSHHGDFCSHCNNNPNISIPRS